MADPGSTRRCRIYATGIASLYGSSFRHSVGFIEDHHAASDHRRDHGRGPIFDLFGSGEYRSNHQIFGPRFRPSKRAIFSIRRPLLQLRNNDSKPDPRLLF
jgi:hypothetical protein